VTRPIFGISSPLECYEIIVISPEAGYAQRRRTGKLTQHLRRGVIVVLMSLNCGGAGVF
jgi:hypothetical protein